MTQYCLPNVSYKLPLVLPAHTCAGCRRPATLTRPGCESGEVKVWNFSSGACLSKLKPRTSMEVTSVLAVRGALMRHFLVAGWDRKVGAHAGGIC